MAGDGTQEREEEGDDVTSAKEPMTMERLADGLAKAFRRIASLEAALDLFCSDADLDRDPKANPKINFDPKGFVGGSFKGKLANECPPDFLDFYAKTLGWMAENPQEGKEKYAKYNKLDAKRCRSWARRKRLGGWKPPPPPPEPAGLGDLPALGGELGGDPFMSASQAIAESEILGGGTGLPAPPADDSDLAGPWDAPVTETPVVSDVAGDDLDGLPE